MGGVGPGPRLGVCEGPVDVIVEGTDERLLRRSNRAVAMIATAAIASMINPVGDVRSANIDSAMG